MKSFSQWSIEEVEDTFNVVIQKHSSLLQGWLEITESVVATQEEEIMLNELCERLQDHVWDWNEWELKVKFIMPLLLAVNFDQERYQSFIEREISVLIENERLVGTVDFVVASGKRSPKRPYFFINEFKKEKESSNDPLGQLMVAMISAQRLNNDNNPLYGAYVMGRFWFFVVLHGQEYSTSLAYDATKHDIKELFGILKKTKGNIELMTKA